MKMFKFMLTFMLISWSMSEEAAASCLEKAVLEKIGFTAADAIEKVTDPTYCTDVYADPGRCITADSIKTFIDAKQTLFSESNSGYGQLVEMFDTFFGNIGESLSNLWDKITDSTSEKTWKDKMAEEVKKAQDAHDTCFKTHNQIMHGISCMLSSGVAGQKATVSGDVIKIKSGKAALQLVSDCMPVVAAICMFYKGGEEAKLEVPQTDMQKKLCEEHKKYEECMSKDGGTATTCLDEAAKKKFFPELYAPFKNIWMPKVEDVKGVTDKMLEWLGNTKDKVFSWFKSTDEETASGRMLEGTITLEYEFEDDGYDIYAAGAKSGVEVKGVKIYSLGIIVSLIGLFLQLN